MDEKNGAIIKEINRLDDTAKIIIKSAMTVYQNKLMEIANGIEEIKKEIKLEEN